MELDFSVVGETFLGKLLSSALTVDRANIAKRDLTKLDFKLTMDGDEIDPLTFSQCLETLLVNEPDTVKKQRKAALTAKAVQAAPIEKVITLSEKDALAMRDALAMLTAALAVQNASIKSRATSLLDSAVVLISMETADAKRQQIVNSLGAAAGRVSFDEGILKMVADVQASLDKLVAPVAVPPAKE